MVAREDKERSESSAIFFIDVNLNTSGGVIRFVNGSGTKVCNVKTLILQRDLVQGRNADKKIIVPFTLNLITSVLGKLGIR